MNGAGLFLATAGVWVLSQILAGEALDRLGIFGDSSHQGASGAVVNPDTVVGGLLLGPAGAAIGGIVHAAGGLVGGKKKKAKP